MKVGILTFHFAPNYGAVLQAWGLQTALRELGHEAEFLDYQPRYMRPRTSPFRGWGVTQGMRFPKLFFHRLRDLKRRRAFADFRTRQLKVTPRLNCKSALAAYCRELDAVVVGSDQVWNTRWMRDHHDGFDDTYFLGFLPEQGGPRRVAYAPCFGDPNQPPEFLTAAGMHIKRFSAIGMRNAFGAKILKDIGVAGVQEVVDPAFFLRRSLRRTARGGVVVYAVSDNTNKLCSEVAVRMSTALAAPIVHLPSEAYIALPTAKAKRPAGATPEEWMSEIVNAAFVCSESFHGVVFAIAAGVPFCAATAGLRSHRVADLLVRYSLGNRLVCESMGVDTEHLAGAVDSCHPELARDIEQSMSFLNNALT